jgi:hypothetical protein
MNEIKQKNSACVETVVIRFEVAAQAKALLPRDQATWFKRIGSMIPWICTKPRGGGRRGSPSKRRKHKPCCETTKFCRGILARSFSYCCLVVGAASGIEGAKYLTAGSTCAPPRIYEKALGHSRDHSVMHLILIISGLN